MRTYNVSIPAGGSQVIPGEGSYIFVDGSTGALQGKTDNGDTFIITNGSFGKLNDFKEVTFFNKTASTIAASIFIGDNSETFGKYQQASDDVPDLFTGAQPILVNNSLIAPASQKRDTIIISFTHDANPAWFVFLTHEALKNDAYSGLYMKPGDTAILRTKAAIYGHTGGGTVQMQVQYTSFS